jgi:hypothetical protein
LQPRSREVKDLSYCHDALGTAARGRADAGRLSTLRGRTPQHDAARTPENPGNRGRRGRHEPCAPVRHDSTTRARAARLDAARRGPLCVSRPAHAQEIPAVLSDKIYKGHGVIDILKDADPGALQQYFDANGRLMLGIDVNSAATGNETNKSQGIAIQSIELVIRTTAGDFTFSDFYTSTTAMVIAAGSTTAEEYYTVFGTGGSNAITGGSGLAGFDDVIYIDGIAFTGEILGATLNVTFLDTANTGSNTNEAFFDYSNGFEDLAILGASEASALEAANLGEADAPSSVSYSSNDVAPSSTPGAPAPPLGLLLGVAALALLKARRR